MELPEQLVLWMELWFDVWCVLVFFDCGVPMGGAVSFTFIGAGAVEEELRAEPDAGEGAAPAAASASTSAAEVTPAAEAEVEEWSAHPDRPQPPRAPQPRGRIGMMGALGFPAGRPRVVLLL
eukprot:g9567.t1